MQEDEFGHTEFVPGRRANMIHIKQQQLTSQLEKCLRVLAFIVQYMSKADLQKFPLLVEVKKKHPFLRHMVEAIDSEFHKKQAERERREQEEKMKAENPYADAYGEERNYDNYYEQQGGGEEGGEEETQDKKEVDEEDDYLGSNLFLTDDDEGYYYEKKSEERKRRKNKSRQRQLLLVPIEIFSTAAELELFAPRSLSDVIRSAIEFIEKYNSLKQEYLYLKETELRQEQERKDKLQQKLKKKEEKEASKTQVQPFYGIPEEKGEGEGEGEDKNGSEKDEDDDAEKEPIDLEMLESMSPEEQMMLLGERLYVKIEKLKPNLGGKLTGMILDALSSEEILHLLEDKEALETKVEEAAQALNGAAADAGEDAYDNDDTNYNDDNDNDYGNDNGDVVDEGGAIGDENEAEDDFTGLFD